MNLSLKIILENLLSLIGIYNISFIVNILKVPRTIILNEIKKKNLKYYLFFGRTFFLKKDIYNLKKMENMI